MSKLYEKGRKKEKTILDEFLSLQLGKQKNTDKVITHIKPGLPNPFNFAFRSFSGSVLC